MNRIVWRVFASATSTSNMLAALVVQRGHGFVEDGRHAQSLVFAFDDRVARKKVVARPRFAPGSV